MFDERTKYQVVEVNDAKTRKDFLLFPLDVFRNDPNWIRPLDKDIEAVFNPETNKYFRHGEIIRWVIYDRDDNIAGKVAAFINSKAPLSNDMRMGGMGFFDCVNDGDAAFTLFDTCKNWLVSKGIDAMDGPINFGERERWWGLLVDGFDPPNYLANYNPPYYREFFEAYGFKVYYKQYTYKRFVMDPLADKYKLKSERVQRNPDYRFQHMKLKNYKQYAEDFRYVYNKAWKKHSDLTELSKSQALTIIEKLKPVIDEKAFIYGYYKDEPIAFFIMIPEVNQIFRHLNGKLDWLGKLKYLWYKKRGACRKLYGLVFGVTPEQQGKGVEGALIMTAGEIIQPLMKYDVLEMAWIGSFNPKMIHVVESVGATLSKTHITFRKIFDPDKPFFTAPEIS